MEDKTSRVQEYLKYWRRFFVEHEADKAALKVHVGEHEDTQSFTDDLHARFENGEIGVILPHEEDEMDREYHQLGNNGEEPQPEDCDVDKEPFERGE